MAKTKRYRETVPPEVVLDYHHVQVLALTDAGGRFPRYVDCPGCGWSIGCGDATGEIWHESCARLAGSEAQ